MIDSINGLYCRLVSITNSPVHTLDYYMNIADQLIAAGAEEIALYNLAGQLVKKVNSSVMGVEDVAAGAYIVKAGNAVKKVVLK